MPQIILELKGLSSALQSVSFLLLPYFAGKDRKK
jgi:hypothetical protein